MFLLLFTWKLSYSYQCLSLISPLVMLVIIGWGYREVWIKERECFINCYIDKDATWLATILSSRFFVSIFYLLSALVMTLSAFIASLDFPILLWSYLVLHIGLSLLLLRLIEKLFSEKLKQRYSLLFAREWTINIMAIILIAVFFYISLNEYIPAYLTRTLQETIINAQGQVSSSCEATNLILKYGKMIDGSFWWIVNEGTEKIDNSLVKMGIWSIFLFYNALALIGINRLIVLIIYYMKTNEVFKKKRG